MRFAITAIDRYLGVFESFVHAGWEPVKLFTIPARNALSNQQAVISYAEKNKAAIQLSRMTERDLRELKEQGCETLIVASYDWKTPDWRPYLKYGVNIHCSPLPHGRGPYPTVRAIIEKWLFWGVTCHQLTPDIDQGDIMSLEAFRLSSDETHESLDLKIQMAAKRLATRVAHQFTDLWTKAQKQENGSYWPAPRLQERIIDFNKTVEDTLRLIRAYGTTESLAQINGSWLVVRRALGWPEAHNAPPGNVVHIFNQTIVVAVLDGYIAIQESDFAPPEVVAALSGTALS